MLKFLHGRVTQEIQAQGEDMWFIFSYLNLQRRILVTTPRKFNSCNSVENICQSLTRCVFYRIPMWFWVEVMELHQLDSTRIKA